MHLWGCINSHIARLEEMAITMNTTPVLAGPVAPHSVPQFLSDHWPEQVFMAHGEPARLPAFLRAPELANVATLSRRYRGKLRFTHGRSYQKEDAGGGRESSD